MENTLSQVLADCAITPNSSETTVEAINLSTSTTDATPSSDYEIPGLIGFEDSALSASSTPRDDSSSGSPSPILDDGFDIDVTKAKPTVRLEKDLSMMMKALNSLQSPEEKIAALCKKYADHLDYQKSLRKQLRLSEKKQSQSLKEKERLQTDNNKAVMARTKLENLCRELQKRNKAIKDEQNQKSMEEVTRRQKMAADFQKTLDNIQNQMKSAVDGSSMLQSENKRIGGKLNEIIEEYKSKEIAMENMLKEHDRQNKLLNSQMKKTLLEHQEEKHKNAQEQHKLLEQLLEKNTLYEAKVNQEKELKAQLQFYSEKFEDFQSTIGKSNELFKSFRSEMDDMSKRLKQAETHRAMMQKKYDDSVKALANTIEHTQLLEAKQTRLEKLSRALQAERNELSQRLRQYEEEEKKAKEGSKSQSNERSASRDGTLHETEGDDNNDVSCQVQEVGGLRKDNCNGDCVSNINKGEEKMNLKLEEKNNDGKEGDLPEVCPEEKTTGNSSLENRNLEKESSSTSEESAKCPNLVVPQEPKVSDLPASPRDIGEDDSVCKEIRKGIEE